MAAGAAVTGSVTAALIEVDSIRTSGRLLVGPVPSKTSIVRQPRLLVSLLALGFCTAAALADQPRAIAAGERLDDVRIQGLNVPSRRLSTYRGRALIINVWASWCGPCRAEMASLERLAWMGHPAEFAVIGVSTDDFPERARSLLRETNATIPHFIDSGLRVETMLGASRLPLTVIVDADGRVVQKVYGARQWDSPDMIAEIDRLFGNPLPVSQQ